MAASKPWFCLPCSSFIVLYAKTRIRTNSILIFLLFDKKKLKNWRKKADSARGFLCMRRGRHNHAVHDCVGHADKKTYPHQRAQLQRERIYRTEEIIAAAPQYPKPRACLIKFNHRIRGKDAEFCDAFLYDFPVCSVNLFYLWNSLFFSAFLSALFRG